MTSAERSLFVPRGRYDGHGVTRAIWILEWGRNPSTDYYILPRCSASAGVSHRLIDIRSASPSALDIPEGTFVVIVRYATAAWLRHLHGQRERLTGVAYFMDDDLPVALADGSLPWRYRYKILRYFWLQRRALARVCSDIWVSTSYLADRYGIAPERILEPVPWISAEPRQSGVTYFYEGTTSHTREFHWLREVVVRVQGQTDDLTFLTVGPAAIRRIFSGLPRVLCLHPVDWSTYKASFPAVRHDIGLAPLLDTAHNRARSPTKFFDISRYGAVGIYSNVPPYAGFVHSGEGGDGWLLDNDPEVWSDTILRLAGAETQRALMAMRARHRIESACVATNVLPIASLVRERHRRE